MTATPPEPLARRPSGERFGRGSGDPGGLDPWQRAVLTGPHGTDPEGDDAPPPLPRLTVGRLRVGSLGLLLGLFGLLGLATLFRGGAQPQLTADCARPALAVSATQVRPGGLVEWALVGPDDGRVVLALGAAAVDPRTLELRPLRGRQAQRVTEPLLLSGCRAAGRFGVQLPPGDHELTAFRLTGGGARPLASTGLEVVGR